MNEEQPECQYGDSCFRKNPQHMKKFKHKRKRSPSPVLKKDILVKGNKITKRDRKIEDFFKHGNQTSAIDKEMTPVEVATAGPQLIAVSTEEDETDAAPEAFSPEEVIKQRFLVDMPKDFYEFWDFCKSLSFKDPQGALKDINLQLVGPYDVLGGKCTKMTQKGQRINYLRHWRYYYDPPELMTIVKGDDTTQFHMGYYRDDPKEMPAFVAWSEASTNCLLIPKGENIFASIKIYIEEAMKGKSLSKTKGESMLSKLTSWATDKQLRLDTRTPSMKARDKKVVCKTFHGAGIVVPVDSNDVGYRPVPETPGDLKRMFKKIAEAESDAARLKAFDELQELITLVQFANDECDYGEGLELGLDLLSFGGDVFHKTILNMLTMAYQLLGRPEYGQVITAHLENRSKSVNNLSVIG